MSREIKWVLTQLKPFMGLQLARLACIIGMGFLAMLDPLVLKWVIDDILPNGSGRGLALAVSAFFLVMVFRLYLTGLGSNIHFFSTQRLVLNIRLLLVKQLQKQTSDYFKRNAPGDLQYRIGSDVETLQHLGSTMVATVVTILVTSGFSLTVMFLLNWKLTLMLLPLIPVFIVLRKLTTPKLTGYADKVQEMGGLESGFLQECLTAMPQIQLLNAEKRTLLHYFRIARKRLVLGLKQRKLEILIFQASGLVLGVSMVLVLAIGGRMVLAGAFTIGSLVAFNAYLARLFEPLESVVDVYADFQRSAASIRRILAVLDQEPGLGGWEKPAQQIFPPMVVTVCNLKFSHYDGHQVLRKVSFETKQGQLSHSL